MVQLGYTVSQYEGIYSVSSSGDRKLVFVGDLVDRGPGA
jgi:protein phosphatase